MLPSPFCAILQALGCSDELRPGVQSAKLDRFCRRIDLEAKLVFLISARPCGSTFKRKLDWTAVWTIAEMGGY